MLFSIFIDDIVYKIKQANFGCYLSLVCTSIFLFADDILLVAPSVSGLQYLLNVCERELEALDMRLNINKSICIRFGQRFDFNCSELHSLHGGIIKWSTSCRYLGVYFISGRTFRCSFDGAKASFFRAFNAIFGKVGQLASEETVLALIQTKCLPVLLYATEVCPLLVRDVSSLEFTTTRVLMKLFRTGSSAIISECQRFFNFLPIKLRLTIRTAKFLQAFAASENQLCFLFKRLATQRLNDILANYSVDSLFQLTNAVRVQLLGAP